MDFEDFMTKAIKRSREEGEVKEKEREKMKKRREQGHVRKEKEATENGKEESNQQEEKIEMISEWGRNEKRKKEEQKEDNEELEEDGNKEVRKEETEVKYHEKENNNSIQKKEEKAEKIEKAENEKETNENGQKNSFIIIPQEIQSDQAKVSLKLRDYVKHLLQSWESNVSTETDQALLVETKTHIAPLLVQLRKNKLPIQMFSSLATVCYYLQTGKLNEASQAYMKLSIGNTTYPIGLAGVGMHARSALEKITGDKDTANVMLNEKTRKWITSIKRLITLSTEKKIDYLCG